MPDWHWGSFELLTLFHKRSRIIQKHRHSATLLGELGEIGGNVPSTLLPLRVSSLVEAQLPTDS